VPEGDSYTRAAARARPYLVGREVTAVEGSARSVRRHSRSILGRRVDDIRTRGKHLLFDMDSGLTIHVHLGMPGRVRTGRGSLSARDRGPLRLGLSTEAGSVWVLSAPTVEVARREEIEGRLERLGPDLLAEEFDWDKFRLRAGRYPDDRTVSDFLLDQRVMAGVGNEYKCEVLFLEKILPNRRMSEVDSAAREALAHRARRLLLPNARRAVRSTTGRPDEGAWVYGRNGLPCRRCRTAIEEEWVGDPPRITYWCPTCQG
jgi:endonuclease VIII